MAKGQVKRSKHNKPKLTSKERAAKKQAKLLSMGSGRRATVAKAKPGKRGQGSVKKTKVVYDQARVDLLASL